VWQHVYFITPRQEENAGGVLGVWFMFDGSLIEYTAYLTVGRGRGREHQVLPTES